MVNDEMYGIDSDEPGIRVRMAIVTSILDSAGELPESARRRLAADIVRALADPQAWLATSGSGLQEVGPGSAVH